MLTPSCVVHCHSADVVLVSKRRAFRCSRTMQHERLKRAGFPASPAMATEECLCRRGQSVPVGTGHPQERRYEGAPIMRTHSPAVRQRNRGPLLLLSVGAERLHMKEVRCVSPVREPGPPKPPRKDPPDDPLPHKDPPDNDPPVQDPNEGNSPIKLEVTQ